VLVAETGSDLDLRDVPISMSPNEFRTLGHCLIDQLADFIGELADRPVAPGVTPVEVRAALGGDGLPEQGTDPVTLLDETTRLLLAYSTFVGHPRFAGYIVGSPAPIGALADLLAASIGVNVGAFALAPAATEIETQTVRWIAELMGYPTSCGGLMVSGGNMANMVGFFAARRNKAQWDVRATGMEANPGGRLRAYASAETHTWINKAADLSGLGTDSVRWIPTDDDQRMDMSALREAIDRDRINGDLPFLVVGAAGSVSTGAVDPLPAIAELCREQDLWFHVDGAYGGFAVISPNAPADLLGLRSADSIAVDPHKWLYSSAEAGCVLVRNPQHLLDTFSYRPPYYQFDTAGEEPVNYYEYGPQNSRGFKALKVWLALRQVGRAGYESMISRNIAHAQELHEAVDVCPELDAWTRGLSFTTFRYVPPDLRTGNANDESYLNDLNTELVTRIQKSGELFLSNAVVRGTYLLRACWVNFNTTSEDIQAIPEIATRLGAAVDAELRPKRQVAVP
jgi:aromatic-L-amino-acid/L-tryptophan decarboxylase